MRDKCVEAVTRAALSMGRTISQTELRGIEDRMLATRREMARSDRDKFLKMSEKERLEESARRATEQILHEALKKKQRAELQIAKDAERKQILEKMQARGLSPAEALTRYTFFHADGRGGIVSMESSAKAVSANWKRQLAALWDLEHSNLINIFTDKKAQRDFFNELYGGDSGNPLAKKAAQQYNALLDKILVDMNDIGFDIPKMVDYRSPQKLSWYKVWQEFKKDPDAIVRDWMAHVDRAKYVNNDGTVMNDAELSKFLREAVQTIATDGLNKPVGQGSGSVANLHKQHRQLHWKDADSFMYIMDKYSESNPVDMIWSQLDRMGREYAMVQKFGPNAIDGFKNEVSNIAEGVGAADTLELRKIEEAFDSFLGIRQAITHPRTHRLFSNLRQMQSAALLGSNTITQLADQATLVQTARAMNIPVAQAFTEQLRQASSAADREVARSLGLGIESIATNISRVADSGGEGFWGKASNAVLTLNLSNHLTTATRSGFGVAMMSHIGSMVRRFDSVSKLSEADRRVMESKGVTDEQWSLWKMAAKDPSYKDVVSPDSIAKLSDAEVLKVAPERVSKIMEQGKEIQSKMDTLNQKEQEWLNNRKSKFAEWRASMEKMVDDYINTRERRVGEYDQSVTDRIAEMTARLEVAEADAQITQASIKAQQDNRFSKFSEQVKRGMEIYGQRRSSIGEALGAKRHSQKLAKYALDKELEGIDKALSGKFGDNISSIKKAVADYDTHVEKMQQRIDRSTKQNGQPKAGKEGTIERAKQLQDDAKIELEAIRQRADQSFTALRERLAGQEVEIEALQKVLENRRNQAETEADIAAYLATETSVDKIQSFLDTLNFRGDQTIERSMSEGERLGYKKAAADYRARVLTKNLEVLEKRSAKEGFAKATEIEKRIDKRMKELEEFEARSTARTESREAVLNDWESKVGSRLAKEAEAARQEAIQQLLGMTIEETHMASLQPSILATQPLKNQGELGKLFFQFKQFPLAYFTQHVMQRSAMGGQGIANRAKYLIPLLGMSSILGGMALLISDIAAGRDPREAYNEDDPRTLIKFGMAAFFKGGGLGILADLMNPENALTTDPVARQVGPGVGYGVNVLQLGHKSLSAIFAADEAEREKALEGAGGEVAQIVKSSIPGQNIWYTRAVLHNLILNDMHELMSPGYKDRLKGATERNFGSGYWIGGDEGVRAPNLSNIMGQD